MDKFNFLKVLPAELRCIIYHEVLEGFTTDTCAWAGAFLTCKQLYLELFHELPKAFHVELNTMLSELQAKWTVDGIAPLRISQQGSAYDNAEVTIELPISYFHDAEDTSPDEFDRCWDILAPLLAFRLRTLTICFYMDEKMAGRSLIWEPDVYGPTVDLGSLLVYGNLAQHDHSVPGRRNTVHAVHVKRVVFNWSTMYTLEKERRDLIAVWAYAYGMSDEWEMKPTIEIELLQADESVELPETVGPAIAMPDQMIWTRRTAPLSPAPSL
ncbi:uncharacterized protein K460DRAFT_353189 [Cucurbitaria berberidis CBS 394.84]|uniref:Uncharacterized protein n=1 Tax=Cucurbitaria berberidis CBS 394.84 TaxID=1168544 RepID=A0A9P4GN00_9PLEO|nr:uncharacterized protein K460DRAFT_353189 [Cucurbitaria berberidis CBS 394.84]KAF1848172.1 hypothetical protein K460DRAFT_353189 [Cucurbitaria berberidis CBS 394.84]